MIKKPTDKKVVIHITTYKNKDLYNTKGNKINMNDKSHTPRHQNDGNKFLCSICLNSNNHCASFKNHTCSVCKQRKHRQKEFTCNLNSSEIERPFRRIASPSLNTKTVQTSQTDLNNDLNLLQEVLTVFQSKKHTDFKRNDSKTVLTKDVSVETVATVPEPKLRLVKSKIFQYSIREEDSNSNNFKIINSQPNNIKTSQFSIDLNKQKSSSIPQMKIEEIKYSMKAKTKSKDAIEEVNRMFATVRRNESDILEETNRPVTRHGPRVLPVVKAATYDSHNKYTSSDSDREKKDNLICKCCQTNNLQLSGGDSFKHECCFRQMLCESKCEKCVHMMCCHYRKKNKMDVGVWCYECGNKTEDEDKCCGH